jgi:hypothetical protein
METFFDYLMSDMAEDINSEWEDNSEKAHELCFLLSLEGSPVPETFYNIYSANLSIPAEILENATAFFHGCGFLTVDCDCKPREKPLCFINSIDKNLFFLKGKESADKKDKTWLSLNDRILTMKESLISEV